MSSPPYKPTKKFDAIGDRTFDRAKFEMYQAFMAGYVRRINQATFKVAIGGVRIGHAKYSRLAQINLKSRIITFSRYAIENVPERGRRYLVLHELAHVKEASHNQRFWNFVGQYEPDYRQIGQRLETAFKQNVDNLKHNLILGTEHSTLFSLSASGHNATVTPANGLHHYQPVTFHKPDIIADTTGGTTILKPDLNDLRNLGDSTPTVTYPSDEADDERIWKEIEDEFTFWRDNSDDDSDVDTSATECYDDSRFETD